MEPRNHEEKLDEAWVDDAASTSKESMLSKVHDSSPTQTELLSSDRTHSGKVINSTRGVVPRPSFKSKRSTSTLDKNGGTFPGVMMGPAIPLSDKRTASMPVTPFLESSLGSPGPSSIHQVSSNATVASESGSGEMKNIARSSSVPLNKIPLPPPRKLAGLSSGATVLLKSITPRTTVGTSGDDNTATKVSESITIQTDAEKGEKEHVNDGDEEIPEEEAVCRICFEELSEKHGETFKMECSCRGEMALAHKDCALKWFSIKGNRTCDICGLEVCNLPMTVVRQGNQPTAATGPANPLLETHTRWFSVWQDVPVLVMLSMLVYFCFLEQLLVGQMGSGALAISLPFSCVLGLLAAITASNLVEKQYVWLYATCQLALVICFAHIFYDVVHVESVLSILLSAFVGFGTAMVTSTLIIEYNNWKRRTAARAQREREAATSAQTLELNSGGQPAADPQQDHVVLQMEGGGLASLWLQLGDSRQAQSNPQAH
uniref:E3 ubiquitin ligase n=1 Tax=Grimmia pilifera TaxID=254107 RepID=A0A1L7B5N1_9BRYO|nr:E3 ubiquitin ligase [Grimmia pilifera]